MDKARRERRSEAARKSWATRRARSVLDSESFPVDAGWEDAIVTGSFRRNRDGSITIHCQIDVSGDGQHWTTNREIRLEKA